MRVTSTITFILIFFSSCEKNWFEIKPRNNENDILVGTTTTSGSSDNSSGGSNSNNQNSYKNLSFKDDLNSGSPKVQINSSCTYWNGTQYAEIPWQIAQNGFNGNGYCLKPITPRAFALGGWMEFTYNYEKISKVKIKVKAYQPGYSKRIPTVYVNGKNLGSAEVTSNNLGNNWFEISSPPIPEGSNSIRFEWTRTGTSYDYAVDDFEVWD